MFSITGLELLGAAGAIFAILGILATTMAFFFSRYKEANKDILRKDIQDLNGNLETVTNRLVMVETSEKNCQQRLARAEATIQTLTDVVTGASAVAELKEVVDKNHQSIMAKLNQLATR